uniref:Uncharacterized protein n=1 Tax=Saimiri boliviensis boliviensis TaxID=39432 RepID=A0A2K6S543_SAIBB
MLLGVLGKTFQLVGYIIQYGCIAHCAFEYVGGPTIQNSNIVFAESLSDTVIAKSPSDPKSNICKRVIGLERDKILTMGPSNLFKSHSYVPVGHIWLEGGNLQNSTDSRYCGPILGRIFFKIWPLSDFGFLRASPNGHRFSDN